MITEVYCRKYRMSLIATVISKRADVASTEKREKATEVYCRKYRMSIQQ